MKLKVEGSSPLSSVLTLLLYLSTLFHRVYSLVFPALILVSPRSPCLPTYVCRLPDVFTAEKNVDTTYASRRDPYTVQHEQKQLVRT
jgi:hypothetical protein